MSEVLLEKTGNVATLTLNRPERLNAISGEMLPLFRSKDFREGMTAFLEKRKPEFEGR